MKKLFALLLALVMVLGLVACGAKEEAATPAATEAAGEAATEAATSTETIPLTVMIMSEDPMRLAIQQIVMDNYKEVFPNYEVEFIITTQEYPNKLAIACSSGDMPDVFWMSNSTAIETGNALVLTEMLEECNWSENLKSDAGLLPYKDGEIYTVQSGQDAYYLRTVWYNTEIFEAAGCEVPTTYAEFLDVCQKLKDYGVTPLAMAQSRLAEISFGNFITTIDAEASNKLITKQINWSDPAVVGALEKMDEMAENGYFNADVVSASWDAPLNMFNEGLAAMWYEPTWGIGSITLEEGKYDFFLMPTDDGSKASCAWGSYAGGYGIAADSEYPEEALELAKWIVLQDAIYFEQEQNTPVILKTGLEAPAAEGIQAKNNEIVEGGEWTLVPALDALWESEPYGVFKEQMDAMISQQIEPADVVETMNAYW